MSKNFRFIFDVSPTNILPSSLWLKSTNLDEIFPLVPKSEHFTSQLRFILPGISSQSPKLPVARSQPTPHECAKSNSCSHLSRVHSIAKYSIYFNHVMSHQVTVLKWISMQQLRRRFRPNTACFGLILNKYSHVNIKIISSLNFEIQ